MNGQNLFIYAQTTVTIIIIKHKIIAYIPLLKYRNKCYLIEFFLSQKLRKMLIHNGSCFLFHNCLLECKVLEEVDYPTKSKKLHK